MRTLLLGVCLTGLSGCADFTAWVQTHAATIGAVGMVAGALAASEAQS